MNRIDDVAKKLDGWVIPAISSEDIARALDDAGLIMPDLPVSDDSGNWNIPGPGDLTVHNGRTPGPEVVLEDIVTESYDIFVMQPDEARHVALALLSASNYAEEHANDQ